MISLQESHIRPNGEWKSAGFRAGGVCGELRRSFFSPLIRMLYILFNCKRRWSVGRLLLKIAVRLESGEMRSATARELMSEFHGVNIGAYSYGECFNPKTGIPSGITIGRYVSIASGARIFTQNHPLDRLSTHPFFYLPTPGTPEKNDLPPGSLLIGNDVWIGCNALITPSCHRIGNGAVIGAGAVVTHDVPDYAIVAGSPAKRIRDRFSATVIARLQNVHWWELTIEEVQSRKHEFERLLRD